MVDKKLNASFDVGKENDVRPGYYGGLEYWIAPVLALRAGFTGTSQEGNGVRAGLGLKIRDLSFDYAYSNYGDLGMSHRYEVSWRFGTIHPLLTPEERALLRRARLALAEGHYGEAVMLFDSLVTLVPEYRPAHRLEVVAMKGLEGQDAAEQQIGNAILRPAAQDDGSIDVPELTDLFQQSEDAEKVAAARENGSPNAEEATLAPMIPGESSGASQP
jgi:hypothetical protein